jgi:hypothetical protein
MATKSFKQCKKCRKKGRWTTRGLYSHTRSCGIDKKPCEYHCTDDQGSEPKLFATDELVAHEVTKAHKAHNCTMPTDEIVSQSTARIRKDRIARLNTELNGWHQKRVISRERRQDGKLGRKKHMPIPEVKLATLRECDILTKFVMLDVGNEKVNRTETAFDVSFDANKQACVLTMQGIARVMPASVQETLLSICEKAINLVRNSLDEKERPEFDEKVKSGVLPQRLFFCVYDKDKKHGSGTHTDTSIQFRSVVLKLTGKDKAGECLRLYTSHGANVDSPRESMEIRLSKAKCAIFPQCTWYSVDSVARKSTRVTFNILC